MKKTYLIPETEVVLVESENLLTDSFGAYKEEITQDKDILSREFEFVFE